jgi:hypothetical protein
VETTARGSRVASLCVVRHQHHSRKRQNKTRSRAFFDYTDLRKPSEATTYLRPRFGRALQRKPWNPRCPCLGLANSDPGCPCWRSQRDGEQRRAKICDPMELSVWPLAILLASKESRKEQQVWTGKFKKRIGRIRTARVKTLVDRLLLVLCPHARSSRD